MMNGLMTQLVRIELGLSLIHISVNFLLLPGQPIKISGSLDEYKLEGGSFYDDYNEVLEDCKAYSHKRCV